MAKEQGIEVSIEEPRRYSIAKASAPFNKGKRAVESAEGGKFRMPATWLNQQVREERGYQDDVSRNGNWVLEGVLYAKNKRILTPTGLPYLHPDEAVSAHSQGREYTLEGCTQEKIDKAVAEGLEVKASDLNSDGNLAIPCDDFGSNRYGLFFFGGKGADKEKSDRAKKSGLWLINSPEKIKEVIVYLDGKDYSAIIGKDYANQMWFRGLGGRSGFGGSSDWDLAFHCDDGVLGVNDSTEGAAQKSA